MDELLGDLEPAQEGVAIRRGHGLEEVSAGRLLEQLVELLEEVEPLVSGLVLAKHWACRLPAVRPPALALASGLACPRAPWVFPSCGPASPPGQWVEEASFLICLPGCELLLPRLAWWGSVLWLDNLVRVGRRWLRVRLWPLSLEAELDEAALAQLRGRRPGRASPPPLPGPQAELGEAALAQVLVLWPSTPELDGEDEAGSLPWQGWMGRTSLDGEDEPASLRWHL
ncbi:MAG: hypothetical protein GY772_22075 [bacterium]|nr:hypothetical protein [bacterium]